MKHVWVVEIKMDNGKWEPTVEVGITREDARNKQKHFRIQGFETRARKYVRAER